MTDRIVLQRVRNRIIEYLDWSSSFDQQVDYQAAATYVNVPNEVINQWEDWVYPNWREHLIAPTFSPEEIDAIGQFYVVWDAVAAQTPDPLPILPVLHATAEWTRLALAAAEALAVFQVRGILAEDEEVAG